LEFTSTALCFTDPRDKPIPDEGMPPPLRWTVLRWMTLPA